MRERITRRQMLTGGLALAGFGLVAGCGMRISGLSSPKVARIGILNFNPPGRDGTTIDDFIGGLHDLGWIKGQNLTIEIRYGDSTYERLAGLAAELVALKLDLIYTELASAVALLTKATSTIPIVFGGIGDSTGGGSVQSLAHPGKNATGTVSLVEGLAQKQLELLKECVPTLSSVAALRHPSVAGQQWRDIQDAAAQFGLVFHEWSAPDVPGIEAAFASLKERPVDGLVVISGASLFVERERIVRLGVQHRLPTMCPFTEYADAGGLLAYAANSPDLWRRAATHADKILRGANPGELPVERPRPRMERAADLLAASVGVLQLAAAVEARVVERLDAAVVRAHHDEGPVADVVDDVAAGIDDLLLATGELPHPAPQPLGLELVPTSRDVSLVRDVDVTEVPRGFLTQHVGHRELVGVEELLVGDPRGTSRHLS